MNPRTSANTVASAEPMNNFSPRAQRVLALAAAEARRLSHNFVGTEHVLLGIVKLNMGVAVNSLRTMRVDLDVIRQEVEKKLDPRKWDNLSSIPYTPRVKKVLALAGKEAKTLKHTYVGTEHILLGLMSEGEGIAARVLESIGVGIERTRHEILREIDPNLPGNEISGEPVTGFAERLVAIFDFDVSDLGEHAVASVEMTKKTAIKELRHMKTHEADRPKIIAALDRALVSAKSLELVEALAEGYYILLRDEAPEHVRKMLIEPNRTEASLQRIGTALQVLNGGVAVKMEVDFLGKWR